MQQAAKPATAGRNRQMLDRRSDNVAAMAQLIDSTVDIICFALTQLAISPLPGTEWHL
jgi:hypothetical protein